MTVPVEQLLSGVLGWVQQRKQEPANPSSGNWVINLLVAAVALVGLSILAYYLWSQSKELAKLRHEKDVAEMEQHSATVQAELTVLEDKREELQIKALECTSKISELDLMIKEAEQQRQKTHAQIDALTSWDDVDRMARP